MDNRLLELERQLSPSILTPIHADFLRNKQIELVLKRDDLLHPILSGNKWRKLKYTLNRALAFNKTTLVSMGGAYSNHLHALAFVGKLLNLKTKAFIRGERPAIFNPTLQDLMYWQMQLEFVSRTAYRELRQFNESTDKSFLKADEFWIPEGGANEWALPGVGELVDEIASNYEVICIACGTGTTLAGIVEAMPAHVQAIGFAALKGADFLTADVTAWLSPAARQKNWHIELAYHGGGFGKISSQLIDFIKLFEQQHGIALDPIYTGKMLFGLYDLIHQDYFKAGQRLIAVHSGGLQGRRGLKFSAQPQK